MTAPTRPPDWFGDVRADHPAPWALVRVSAAQVEAIRQAYAAPETAPTMRALWSGFLAVDRQFREQLRDANLGKLTPHQL